MVEHFPEGLGALRVDLGVVRLEAAEAVVVVARKSDVGANGPAVERLNWSENEVGVVVPVVAVETP